MKLSKENQIIVAFILILYFICWLIVYVAKFDFIKIRGGPEVYFHYFNIKALLIGIIIYLIPYEKKISALENKIKFIVKSRQIMLTESMLRNLKIIVLCFANILGTAMLYAYIYNSNKIQGQSDYLILFLNFIFPFLNIKLLLENNERLSSIINTSIVVYFNIAGIIILSGKWSLSAMILVIYYVGIYLMTKGQKNENGTYISYIVGVLLFIAYAYFTGNLNEYVDWLKNYKLGRVDTVSKSFEIIRRYFSEIGLALFVIAIVIIVVLGCVMCKNIYEMNRFRSAIICSIILLFASTIIYRFLMEMEIFPYCVMNSFRNDINLPLIAIALRLAKIDDKREVNEVAE